MTEQSFTHLDAFNSGTENIEKIVHFSVQTTVYDVGFAELRWEVRAQLHVQRRPKRENVTLSNFDVKSLFETISSYLLSAQKATESG